MLRVFSRIALALFVAGAFQMTAWAGENAPINRLPRTGVAGSLQETVPINQLPGPVSAAIKDRFPKGQILRAEKDSDNGMVKYEVKVRSNGHVYDIDVTPSGKIIKVERDVD
ncbi:MAG TPA: hypothetical protein VJ810_23875 [Blastocatellia bacterium]|nr:hypothetical protein [Blastocatellia bacterium]